MVMLTACAPAMADAAGDGALGSTPVAIHDDRDMARRRGGRRWFRVGGDGAGGVSHSGSPHGWGADIHDAPWRGRSDHAEAGLVQPPSARLPPLTTPSTSLTKRSVSF